VKIQISLKRDKNKITLLEDIFIYDIFCLILFRMRSVSEKYCFRENQNTLYSKIFCQASGCIGAFFTLVFVLPEKVVEFFTASYKNFILIVLICVFSDTF
jgi:hypothetical protein